MLPILTSPSRTKHLTHTTMNYKLFDRHANMSEQTMDQISRMIEELMIADAPSNLINQTYGLYDGYLYDGLHECLENFFQPRNYEMVVYAAEIFANVNNYPPYGEESTEESTYCPPDPEERYWAAAATCSERFSYDDFE